jgi:hypothetical protein
MIKTVTGEDLGSEQDIEEYAEQLAHMLNEKQHLDFTHVYLPLILGGVIIYDRVVVPGETVNDSLVGISTALDERTYERNKDTEIVFAMAETLISRALQKYGGFRS